MRELNNIINMKRALLILSSIAICAVLALVLTCPDQPARWAVEDRRLYQKILRRADGVRYIASDYFEGIYQLRDQALVEGADLCVSYLRSSRGGTAYTCACAMRAGIEWINLAES